MSLSNREMVRLGELLDEALTLTPEQRHVWLDSLPNGDQPLVRTLRDALLVEETGGGGPLDRPPRIDPGGSDDRGVTRRQAGERFGAYELVRPLGFGGMADVWLARRTDGAFERHVALKIPRLHNRPVEMTARFALECNILAALECPGIARLYDAGVDVSGVPYIAMEYVQGEPLVTWCDARGLDEAARIRLFLQVLEVVAYAHEREVIHRDLKPSNILVTGQGEVRLLDFGTARLLQPKSDGAALTRVYGLPMTPEYASPELLRGETIDPRSDIYSLGVVLHELLTGTRPAQPTRPATGDTRRLRGALRDVVKMALQPDPGDRYRDAARFTAALRPFAEGKASEWLEPLKTRRPRVAGLAALAAILLATIWGGWNWFSSDAAIERPQSDAEHGQPAKGSISNPIAQDYYTRGIYSYDQRGRGPAAQDQNKTTIELFKKALAADPNFGLAHARLAQAYAFHGVFIVTDEHQKWITLAKDEMTRADAIDAQLPETHLARAIVLFSSASGFRAAAAIREVRAAQRLDPNVGHHELAELYNHVGLENLAEGEFRKAFEIDPTSGILAKDYVAYFRLLHRPDEYVTALRRYFPEDPVSPLYHLMKGELGAARSGIAALAPANAVWPNDFLKSYLLALEGEKKGSEELLARAIAMLPMSTLATDYHHVTYEIACIYAINGNGAEAMRWLRTTAEKGFRSYTLLTRDPFLDRIRSLPEFREFMAETKVEYEQLQTEFS